LLSFFSLFTAIHHHQHSFPTRRSSDLRSKASPYEAFRQQVRDEINEKLEGVDAYTAGLKIYTTLDTDAQEHVEYLLTDSDENPRSEEHTSELQSRFDLVCRLLLEKKKT